MRGQSLVGRMAESTVFGNAWLRRLIIGAVVALCAFLTLFPQPYRAAMSLTPTNPASLGLGGALGNLGALNTVFGNQSDIEISMRVAHSPIVRRKVSERARLAQRLGMSEIQVARWLDREVDVRSLRGGILLFEMKLRDGELGRDVVGAYGEAVREQLGLIARNQTAYKREVLLNLVQEASERYARAQRAFDSFRLRTRYSQPQAAISAIGERIPELENAIKAKQVELNAQRQFATDDNIRVRQIIAEIGALQGQLNEAKSVSPSDRNSVGRVVRDSTEADRLRRDLDVAQLLYYDYRRFLQGTSVEDLTSTATVRILETAHIDPARQYNVIPLGIGVIVLLLGLAIEFYRLRPPVGALRTA